MIPNSECLRDALEELHIPYKILDQNGNFFEVGKKKKYLFAGTTTPLNSEVFSLAARDKGFTDILLKDILSLPRTLAYLDPRVKKEYTDYRKFNSLEDVLKNIEFTFSFPLIIKRNSGLKGNNVFLCSNREEAKKALMKVFNHRSKNYDYVALAQEYIDIQKEYRVLVLNEKVELVYEKDNAGATFQGNLSPLHWKNARAVVAEEKVQEEIENFLMPLFPALEIKWAGLDIALDKQGKFWLLEINTKPGFSLFIRDNGKKHIVELYKKLLQSLVF